MADVTGIKWTDSTANPWWGCTKVEGAFACVGCYAEEVDKRGTAADQPLHWGHGAPRRRVSEKARNEPLRWQKGADKFFAEHGRNRRVFTLSMGDIFDKEVDDAWRAEHFDMMAACDRLEWQPCTKRISQLPKMVPISWFTAWPRNIGMLITVVTQAEADRDVPRLLKMKHAYGIPWVGVSYEPAYEAIDWSRFLGAAAVAEFGASLDWIIFGGKSGKDWNDQPFPIEGAYRALAQCQATNTSFFMKQVAAFQPKDHMIPADLMIRQWPRGH